MKTLLLRSANEPPLRLAAPFRTNHFDPTEMKVCAVVSGFLQKDRLSPSIGMRRSTDPLSSELATLTGVPLLPPQGNFRTETRLSSTR